jgi:hypothetical protein
MADDLRLGGNGQDTANTAPDLADLATLTNVSPGDDSVDLDDLRMPQDFQESGGSTPIWTNIPIRKPEWPHFVRVHPDPNFCFRNACTIHDKDENEFCLVSSRMLSELGDKARLTNLFLTINAFVVCGLGGPFEDRPAAQRLHEEAGRHWR